MEVLDAQVKKKNQEMIVLEDSNVDLKDKINYLNTQLNKSEKEVNDLRNKIEQMYKDRKKTP